MAVSSQMWHRSNVFINIVQKFIIAFVFIRQIVDSVADTGRR